MARKEDLRFARTNKKLYESFFELIATQKIDDLSITDICEAANINRATFYKHFNDKKAFVFYCVAQKLREQRMQRLGSERAVHVKMQENTLLELYAFFRYMTKLNAENLDVNGHSIRILYDSLLNFYFHEFVAYYAKSNYTNEYIDVQMRAAQTCGSLLSMALFAMLQGEQYLSEDSCRTVVNSRIE